MKRVIAVAVAFLFVLSVAAQAQEAPAPPNAPAPAASPFSHVFSKASIEKAVSADKAVASIPAPAPRVPRSGKNFFKTPWPYVIIGAAVAAGVIIAMNSGSNSNGMSVY